MFLEGVKKGRGGYNRRIHVGTRGNLLYRPRETESPTISTSLVRSTSAVDVICVYEGTSV